MTSDTFADWTSPRAFTLPDLGPGVDGALAQQVSAALRCLSADPAVKAVVLFGSRARGTARADSDLDVLVVERTASLEPEAKAARWWHHFQHLRHLPLPIDLVVSGHDDAARLAGSRWHVISEAARSGRVLAVAE
jgi:predicted nucleotidyltransferase